MVDYTSSSIVCCNFRLVTSLEFVIQPGLDALSTVALATGGLLYGVKLLGTEDRSSGFPHHSRIESVFASIASNWAWSQE